MNALKQVTFSRVYELMSLGWVVGEVAHQPNARRVNENVLTLLACVPETWRRSAEAIAEAIAAADAIRQVPQYFSLCGFESNVRVCCAARAARAINACCAARAINACRCSAHSSLQAGSFPRLVIGLASNNW